MGLSQLEGLPESKRECKHCGKEFGYAFTRPNQKYCSSMCQKTAWKEEQRAIEANLKPITLKACVVCGKNFYPKKGKQDYQITCSNKCKIIRGNLMRKYRGREKFNLDIVSKQCLHCGKKFYVGKDETNEIKFCSTKCNNAHFHIENRSRWNERKKSKWKGNWAKTRERDEFKCQVCGNSPSRLFVHHLDGSGETKTKNHNLDNLITLCGSCHNSFHKIFLLKIDGKWQIKGTILDKLGLTVEVKQN